LDCTGAASYVPGQPCVRCRMNVLCPNSITDTKARGNACRTFGCPAAMQGGGHTPVLQESRNLFWLAQGPDDINLIRGHEAALGKHRLESGDPDFEVALCKI